MRENKEGNGNRNKDKNSNEKYKKRGENKISVMKLMFVIINVCYKE